jgi:hypothetical protein
MVDILGSLKDWNENTKKTTGISGKGRTCINTRTGWKVLDIYNSEKNRTNTISFLSKWWDIVNCQGHRISWL